MKLLVQLIVIIMIVLSISATTIAATEVAADPFDGFLTTFDLQMSDLDYKAPVAKETSAPYGWLQHSVVTQENNNVYGSFTFSGGLNKLALSTFATEKCLVGQGEQGTVVGYLVYTKTDNAPVIVDEKIKVLGSSGMYTETVCFKEDALQVMVVAVSDGSGTIFRSYEVTTVEQATKSFLENINVKFVPSADTQPYVVPSFDLMPSLKAIEF